MKKLFTFLAFIVTITAFSQAPQGFNYQATVRNSSGVLIANQNVSFKFNIMLNTQTSVPVFSETHNVPTDDLGQVNMVIGQGTATTGTFASINWGNGNYYLGIELNTGNGFVDMGITQLLSVPFALYANSSGNGSQTTPDAVTKSYVDAQIAALKAQIPVLPTITSTSPVTAITQTTASSGGTISSDGGSEITARGIVWSTTTNPTIALNTKTINGNGVGTFIATITERLSSKTTYYIKAYATNGIGTTYGPEVSFKTTFFEPITTIQAPTPTRPASNVISIFSDAYTNVPVDFYNGDWKPYQTTVNEDYDLNGDTVLHYTNFNFVGVQFSNPTIDLTSKTNIHFNMYIPEEVPSNFDFLVTLVDFGPDGVSGGSDNTRKQLFVPKSANIKANEWITIDLPIQMTTKNRVGQIIFENINGSGLTNFGIDNLYFYN